ncbi:hypothetical protein O1611_g3807 [Lasiodiplodia mahajangana]|uniref:Uncharacterized protein n=1 Tax=Lasiodiplodia mahajangana TaxID=1108764 RepID=A0ACC2JQS8_9PEZI|nr:hypothetical protein O1611_g3807 [Lasiodiplodia mahajangana]
MERLKRHHRGKLNTLKLCLRLLSGLFGIISVSLAANDAIRFQYWVESHPPSDITNYLPPKSWYLCLPIALYGLAVDSVETALTFIWKRNPGAHPACHICFELLFLGLNAGGLSITSFNIAGTYYTDDSGVHYLEFMAAERIAVVVFVGIITGIRLILLLCASIELYRKNVAGTVEKIAEAIRRQEQGNDNDTTSSGPINHLYQYYRLPPPPQELPETSRSPQELSNASAFRPELPGSIKFPAELSSQLQGFAR